MMFPTQQSFDSSELLAAAQARAYTAQDPSQCQLSLFLIQFGHSVRSGSMHFDHASPVLLSPRPLAHWLRDTRRAPSRHVSAHAGEGFNELVDTLDRFSGM
eukprot:5527568-Pyramimonas_sp.AAC.1